MYTTKQQKPQQSRTLNFCQRKAWHKKRPLNGAPDIFTSIPKLHHAHIVFDKEQYRLPHGNQSNNIGFHSKTGNLFNAEGELFSENISSYNYVDCELISKNDIEDDALCEAIWRCKDTGNYDLFSNNCQHWVKKVKTEYDSKPRNYLGIELE